MFGGLKLGLNLPQSKSAASTNPKPKNAIIFGGDDDDDQVSSSPRPIAPSAVSRQQARVQHQAAATEDPSIFDYDSHVDSVRNQRALKKAKTEAESLDRRPRYMQDLLKRAEERQMEQEIVMERKALRERIADEEQYADKEKFISSAYKERVSSSITFSTLAQSVCAAERARALAATETGT